MSTYYYVNATTITGQRAMKRLQFLKDEHPLIWAKKQNDQKISLEPAGMTIIDFFSEIPEEVYSEYNKPQIAPG